MGRKGFGLIGGCTCALVIIIGYYLYHITKKESKNSHNLTLPSKQFSSKQSHHDSEDPCVDWIACGLSPEVAVTSNSARENQKTSNMKSDDDWYYCM